MMTPLSIQKLCNDLARNGLLLPAKIRNMRQRWLRLTGVYEAVHPQGNDGGLGSPKG